MLVEKKKLDAILKDFYTLTGVRIAVFDEWRREIVAYPRLIGDYCRERRRDGTFDALCKVCDTKAFDMAQSTKQQYTYKCHAGLYESVCPILSQGVVLGFLMIGQFISEEEARNVSDGSNGIKTLCAESVRAIASIMSVCAEYLCFSKTISAHRVGLAERADRYVCAHLGESVSVQEVADHLGISRTSAHTLFKKHFGRSVVEYVNHQKIELAKRMIDALVSTHEILEKINVSDPNYFYRMFKKHAGVSVSEYKRQMLQ